MKATDLRDLDDKGLREHVATQRRELFGLRLQHATGELENTAGLRTAKRELGIRYGVILCAIRSLGPESSLRIAELCVAFKNRGVVGFDLAGSEVNNPAKLHRQAFQLVIDNNINCTAHAGESFGPDSVHQAIHKCGAHHIGHGTRLVESGDLLNYVNDHRIALEAERRDGHRTRRRLLADPGRRLMAGNDLGTADVDGDEVHAGHDAAGSGMSQASAHNPPQSSTSRPSGRRTEAWVEPPAGMTSS